MDEKIKQDLERLKLIIAEKKISVLFGDDPSDKESVALLQRLLNHIGYGSYLNWDEYKDDGIYGDGTKDAIAAFIKDVLDKYPSISTAVALSIADKIENMKIPAVSAESIRLGEGVTVKEIDKAGKTKIYVTSQDTTGIFTKFKKGLYTLGKQKPADIVSSRKSEFQSAGLTDSEINVIMAVSENEGNLDAINTWDNCFLTFGMFQWTIGQGKQDGELPALLKKVKEKDPDIFHKYYGKYGIDIAQANKLTGYFSFQGKEISGPVDKNQFRKPEWAFYFWLSGQDPLIQSIQIIHAVSRIKLFYNSDNYKIKDRYISEIINSEYGVALILDNHVNRPGYIKGCIEQAWQESGLGDPSSWGDEEEQRLINKYLEIRETYGHTPMTHAAKRGENIGKYRDQNILSGKRGSFQIKS